jgi:hypothetical protein
MMVEKPQDFDVEIWSRTPGKNDNWVVLVSTPGKQRILANHLYKQDAQLISDALKVLNHVTPQVIAAWDGE